MLKVGYRTDKGKIRENNEDSFYVSEREGLFIVADGIGGHKAGEVASHLAVEKIREELSSILFPQEEQGIRKTLKGAIQAANAELWKKASWYEELNGMGTTIVVALLEKKKLYVSHVGDSRAYLLQRGNLKRLTEDHSLVADMVREGRLTEEEARHHHLRNVINRALGKEETVEVDIEVFPYRKGDALLLCTDGLTDLLDDDKIREVLLSVSNPQEACDQLVDKANQAGGRDNTTVIVIKEE